MTLLLVARSWTAAAGPVGVAALALAGCAGLGLTGGTAGADLLPGCPFKALTGLDCPGCGATRATRALLQGDVARAASLNVLLLAVIPLALWAWAAWLARSVGWTRPRPPDLPAPIVRAIPVVLVLFWVVRNLPVAPFSSLGA